MKHKHLLTFVSVMLVAWALGTFLFVYFWPHIMYNHFERAILVKGFGDGCPGYLTHPVDILGFSMHILSEVGPVY